MKKLILANFQAPGDLVMLTAAVRDLHRCHPGQFLTDVRTTCPELWENNPYLTPLDIHDPEVQVVECHYPLIQAANQRPVHFVRGFIEDLNQRLDLHIEPTSVAGDIHLSGPEKSQPSPVQVITGRDVPYWIIVGGGKFDFTIKWWHFRRWQAVVNHFRGRMLFVQVGEENHYHPPLAGALDLRGQTSLRDLIRLVYHAQGVLCPVTLLMHLAAAIEVKPGAPSPRPCVVVAGGREPPTWEAYPGHGFIHTIGQLPCCATGGCWRSRSVPLGDGDEKDMVQHLCLDTVNNLPRCMHLITPSMVIGKVERFLDEFASMRLDRKQAEGRNDPRGIRTSTAALMPSGRRSSRREVTVCVLTYGDFPSLARRVVESIRAFCPRAEYELVVGANAVGEATRTYLEQQRDAGVVDRLIDSSVNVNKCPMMRRMFENVDTEFIWWFDDDSYITTPDAWSQWLKAARAAPASTVMWGEFYQCNTPEDFTDLGDVVSFVRKATWYRGLPPPSWRYGGKGEFNFENRGCGDGRWYFIVGGCWLIRTSAIRGLDWPDRRLVKLGDDVLLGEAIRQHGWKLGNIGSPGVVINTEPRRGDAGSSSPAVCTGSLVEVTHD